MHYSCCISVFHCSLRNMRTRPPLQLQLNTIAAQLPCVSHSSRHPVHHLQPRPLTHRSDVRPHPCQTLPRSHLVNVVMPSPALIARRRAVTIGVAAVLLPKALASSPHSGARHHPHRTHAQHICRPSRIIHGRLTPTTKTSYAWIYTWIMHNASA